MEDMEVDVQFRATGSVGSVGLDVPIIIPNSGSSTEVEEDEEAERRPEGRNTAPTNRPRLATTQIVRRRRARCEHDDKIVLQLVYISAKNHINTMDHGRAQLPEELVCNFQNTCSVSSTVR